MENILTIDQFKHKLARPKRSNIFKDKFLKNVTFNKSAYNKFIDELLEEVISGKAYKKGYDISKYNAHNTGIVEFEKVENFCEKLYRYWYANLQQLDLTKVNPTAINYIREVITNDDYKPENMAKFGFYRFLSDSQSEMSKAFKGAGLNIIENQGFTDKIGQDTYFQSGLLRVLNPFKEKDEPQVRLYLNVKSKNIVNVASALYEVSLQNANGLHLKIASKDDRNDTIIIYTSYKNVEEKLRLINHLNNRHPEWFDDCEKLSPLLGVIDDFIGFSEEPKNHRSFNDERKCIFKMCKGETLKTLNKIVESGNPIKCNGNMMNVDDYLTYVLRDCLAKNLQQELEELKITRKIPNRDEDYNIQHIDEYIKGQEEIIVALKKGKFDNALKNSVKQYKQTLKGENKNNSVKVDFYIPNAIWANSIEFNNEKQYLVRKYVEIPDINQQLLKDCPDEAKLLKERVHKLDVQNQYYKENNISIKCPYLNVEPQRDAEWV